MLGGFGGGEGSGFGAGCVWSGAALASAVDVGEWCGWVVWVSGVGERCGWVVWKSGVGEWHG